MFRVESGDVPALAKALRKQADGRQVVKSMTREFRAAGTPVLQAVRAAALGLPSQGLNARRGRPSTRRELARATVMRVRTSKAATVVIETSPQRMREGMRGIPPYFEGEARLRHPTYGHAPWVTQVPTPYFYRTARPLEARTQAAGQAAMDRVATEIERA